MLHGLEAQDRLPELVATGKMLPGRVEHGLRDRKGFAGCQELRPSPPRIDRTRVRDPARCNVLTDQRTLRAARRR